VYPRIGGCDIDRNADRAFLLVIDNSSNSLVRNKISSLVSPWQWLPPVRLKHVTA
jgi:hypothetical protein